MAPGPTTTTTASTRWCPTPEQLMILEEMYRGGVRTPNATQIQQITAHLSLYGKIEGKNVFYWFQNHKARDRQKLRRRLAKHLLLHHQHHHQHQLLYYPQFSHQIQTQTPRHHHHHQQLFNSIHPTNSTLCAPVGTHEYYTSSSPCLPQMETNHDKFKDEEAAAMRTHDDDWVVISSELNSRPVKTLELFPVKSSSCNINYESGC